MAFLQVALALALILLLSSWYIVSGVLRLVGWKLRNASAHRRKMLLARVEAERKSYKPKRSNGDGEDEDWEKVDSYSAGTAGNGELGQKEWAGVVGFFHPFCNAGGGGERVLWAAIRATQLRWPEAVCIVYTGDHEVDKIAMLKRVKERFNIHLYPPTVHFMYLTTRGAVLASTWPYFTLAGQSLGSLLLAFDAFTLLVPDILVDTMGYAFALALAKLLFPRVPTAAYVHYPTISTDMLDSLSAGGRGANAGQGTGLRGLAKHRYWRLFARAYAWAGSHVDVVMTNSSWTQAHIKSLWGPHRRRDSPEIAVVFPPVAVEELAAAVDVSPASEARRLPVVLYIAQFRPEKEHAMVLRAFAKFLGEFDAQHPPSSPSSSSSSSTSTTRPKLVLIGSVRDSDDATRVYHLRLLARELLLDPPSSSTPPHSPPPAVEFLTDAPWPDVLSWLARASVGVNGMWNEHFGIGVVEYQAAGLVSVVNDSGGPKMDIVVDVGDDGEAGGGGGGGGPTGFHASGVDGYAQAFARALGMGPGERAAMRMRARRSAGRFTEAEFRGRWVAQMEALVRLLDRGGS